MAASRSLTAMATWSISVSSMSACCSAARQPRQPSGTQCETDQRPATSDWPMMTATSGGTPKAGDALFDAFYRTHRADAVRWAVALVGDRQVAEQLAQDSLVAVGARLASVDNPGAYLRRTVVH